MLVQIPSKVVQASAKKIVQKSGATIDIQRVRTVEEWIPETEMGPKKLINLRTAAETGMVGEIKLKQFNPSFFLLGTNIYCRASGCSTEVPRSKPSSGSQDFKQDLFLCKAHRTKMRNLVSERCKQEKIHSISTAFRHEDFAGYTNVIGVLEKAYIDISKRNIATCEKKNLRLAEVFLNARNFLIITNALLNPNDDNAQEALPAVFALLEGIMDNLDQPNFMERLVRALQDVMNIILHFFGIIYEWVALDSQEFGGSMLGMVGRIVGAVVGGVVDMIVGTFFDRRRENRSYQWHDYQEFTRQHFAGIVSRYPFFHVPANSMGDLVLDVSYEAPPEL